MKAGFDFLRLHQVSGVFHPEMPDGKQANKLHLKGGVMRGMLVRWVILTGSVLIASYLIDGIRVSGFGSAVGAAAVLGLLNVFFKPLLFVFTLPINILTFGLFTFVINAVLLMMASGVIGGFEVDGFWTSVIGSLVISFINWLLVSFITPAGRIGRVDYIEMKRGSGNRWYRS
jgi:putative membrane protein